MQLRITNWVLTMLLLAGIAIPLWGQQNSKAVAPPLSPSVATPSSKQETSKPATNKAAKTQTASPTPATTPATKSTTAPSSAAQDNPFPEAESEAAAKHDERDATPPVTQQPLRLLPPSGVSSSNAQLSPSDLGVTTIKRHGREDEFTEDLNPAGRIKNDLHIADFYLKDWNYNGSYLRYKDVLQFDPLNERALFGMAKSTCLQNKSAEALAQFKNYLQVYPDGTHAKEAQMFLRTPKKCSGNH
ncbi:MAG TPA: hypothetical protein VMU62_08405 [Acidobacteriaceae bacterium]|nr:hypothetical protein [Acidobacteriaceae bacterium]